MMMNKKIEEIESLLDELKEKNKPVEASDNREKYLSAFESVCNRFDVEVELQEDKNDDEVFSEFNDVVNMSASQLQKWSKNPCSREASEDPVAVIKRNLRLLKRNKEDWTSNDFEDAKRTISFVNRMRGNRPESPREGPFGCPSEWAISLLNWAYTPFDSVPSPSSETKNELEPVEEVTLSSGKTGFEAPTVLYGDEAAASRLEEYVALNEVETVIDGEVVTMYEPELADFKYEDGAKVKWSEGSAMGAVRDRTADSCYDAAIDGDVKVCGEPENPAYLIELFKEGEFTGTTVAHKEDTLEAASFEASELNDSREASEVFHSDQERNEVGGEDDGSVRVPPVAIHQIDNDSTLEVSEDVEQVLDELWTENTE